MGRRFEKAKEKWRSVKHSSHFHNFLLFLLFVCIAAIFWFIIAMNDSVQSTLEMNVEITNKPDSITFINLPPKQIHMTVTDKGTTLLRMSLMKNRAVQFNFREYASDGIFRLAKADIYAALRGKFGQDAQIDAISIDSLRLAYTDKPGKKVPVKVLADFAAASGYVVDAGIIPSKKFVTVYSAAQSVLDTINVVKTVPITRTGLAQNRRFKVNLESLKAARVVPSFIDITVFVEPLVNRSLTLDIKAVNVPEGISLLSFPSTATLEVLVPMNKFSVPIENVSLYVDYNDLATHKTKLDVHISDLPSFCTNPEVKPMSVEYTVIQ